LEWQKPSTANVSDCVRISIGSKFGDETVTSDVTQMIAVVVSFAESENFTLNACYQN
jgi:hypothetical protein